jgi:hypothetical protein
LLLNAERLYSNILTIFHIIYKICIGRLTHVEDVMRGNPTSAERRFEEEFLKRLREFAKQPGGQRRMLTMLAEALQGELTVHPSHRNGQEAPHSVAIENMMRAIVAILDPDFFEIAVNGGQYVSTNLRYVGMLARELEEEVQSFARAEARHAARISALVSSR